MSIKVKHEGNATPGAFASAEGGMAKRRAQEGAQIASTMQSAANAANQQLRGASAPVATPGRSNAQLVHAQAPIVSGGGGGSRGGLGGAGRVASPSSGGDYKFLGGDRTDGAPTTDAFWSENSRAWMRPWRPGEKEAKAYEYKLSAQQRAELSGINSALEDARRSGRYTDAELAELERQADAKRIGIKPLPMPKDETAQETFDKRLVTANGVSGYLDNTGKFQALDGAQKSAADVYGGTHVDEQGRRWAVDGSGKLYQVGADQKDDFAALMKLVPETKTDTQIDPVTKKQVQVEVPMSFEEKEAYLKNLIKMKKSYGQPEDATPAPGTEALDPAILARNPNLAGSSVLAGLSHPPAPPANPSPAPSKPAPKSPLAEFEQYRRK